MIILPAIDLYEGQAVRLMKGDYQRMEIYHREPVVLARDIQAAGGRWLHVVDLEGAKKGAPAHAALIRRICAETALQIELGGGIRSEDTIDAYLEAGVSRIILGTKALTEPEFLRRCLQHYGDAIAVGLDVLDGRAAISAWKDFIDTPLEQLLADWRAQGLRTLICTDISRDGMLGGANTQLYRSLRAQGDFTLIASGGVSSLEDLRMLKEAGADGAIVGKAMYTGAVKLPEAFQMAES